jgi:hypothetical protein
VSSSFPIDAPPPEFAPPHEDPELEGRLAKAARTSGVSSIRGVGEAKLRSAIRRLGIARREITSAFALAATDAGVVMVRAVRVSGLADETLRSAVRDTAFIERRATWEQRTVAGHTIEWADGPRFEVAVWSDDDGVAFHAAGERSTVTPIVEQLLAPASD